ncbi:MAG: hypothetical protein LC751_06640 [Actinobacteria bacterium]|nr:hypothetical protein [Actinomycetota bacterium]
MATLTRERVFEAAPLSASTRRHYDYLLERWPLEVISDKVFMWSWSQIYKWYRCECREIGEENALNGVVYRLLDEPDLQDIECIRGWLQSRLVHIDDRYIKDPTKFQWDEELFHDYDKTPLPDDRTYNPVWWDDHLE